jgi:hypothetical protein
MGRHYDQWAIANAAPQSHHVANCVFFNIGEPMPAQHLEIRIAAHTLAERRRGDFGKAYDIVDDPIMVAIKDRHGIAICGAGHDGGDVLGHVVSFFGRGNTCCSRVRFSGS